MTHGKSKQKTFQKKQTKYPKIAGLQELRELSAEEFNTRYSFEAHELDLNNELSI